MDRSVIMRNNSFELTMHREALGGVSHIKLFKARPGMSWIHWYREEPKNYTWDIEFNIPSDRSLPLKENVFPVWGLGEIRTSEYAGGFGKLDSLTMTGTNSCHIKYKSPVMNIEVERHLNDDDTVSEKYTFVNITDKPIDIDDGAVGLFTPFYDEYYGGSQIAMSSRCHAHIWCGGASSYIKTSHMSGSGPNIGLVLTEGTLNSYSICSRIWDSPFRGYIQVHPDIQKINPGESVTISWKLFLHEGWDEFFEKISVLSNFVRLDAEYYTLFDNESLQLKVQSNRKVQNAIIRVNGKEIGTNSMRGGILSDYKPESLGEQHVEFELGGTRSFIKVWVSPPVDELIKSRVKFIVENQQLHDKTSVAEGAYVPYDNETDQQVYNPQDQDLASGGERVGMGILIGRYLPYCEDDILGNKLRKSIDSYYQFVLRELFNEQTGEVYRDINKKQPERIYNYPWMSDLHLAMYKLRGDEECLKRFVRLYHNYYLDKNGYNHYGIGIPIIEGLDLLKKADMKSDYDQMIEYFEEHGRRLLEYGTHYPAFEVPFEQSIVAPAAQILLEVYSVTRDKIFFDAACEHLNVLEAFNGLQPDYHLHDISIRHWDGYWLGKYRMFGDVFPHYWSTLTASVFFLYYKCTGKIEYKKRSEQIFRNNLCLFTPEGRGRCVYIYPKRINDKKGAFYDPHANDQDWALVNWLKVFGLNETVR